MVDIQALADRANVAVLATNAEMARGLSRIIGEVAMACATAVKTEDRSVLAQAGATDAGALMTMVNVMATMSEAMAIVEGTSN